MRDRTELGSHEPDPTLAAKVGAAGDEVAPVGKVSTRARAGQGLESPCPMGPEPRRPITRQVIPPARTLKHGVTPWVQHGSKIERQNTRGKGSAAFGKGRPADIWEL